MTNDGLFLILRKQNKWNAISPIFYLGDNNPNKDLVKIGAKVIIEKEVGGEVKFIGYSEINSIEKNYDFHYSEIRQFKVYLKHFVKFFPPRQKDKQIRKLLDSALLS